MLEFAGALVGVLLVIASKVEEAGVVAHRCNVSSWYVEPAFRAYGTLLVHRALRHAEATYMNVTPAPKTWPLLRAQGYVPYVTGRAIAIPALARARAKCKVIPAGADLLPGPDLPAGEVELLREHACWDCLSVVCVTGNGRLPFVFGRRRRGVVSFGYLIYCRDLASFASHARALGLYLARHGIAFVVTDADRKFAGMPSWYQDGYPKFFRGGQAPRPGDLAFTERAILGV